MWMDGKTEKMQAKSCVSYIKIVWNLEQAKINWLGLKMTVFRLIDVHPCSSI